MDLSPGPRASQGGPNLMVPKCSLAQREARDVIRGGPLEQSPGNTLGSSKAVFAEHSEEQVREAGTSHVEYSMNTRITDERE